MERNLNKRSTGNDVEQNYCPIHNAYTYCNQLAIQTVCKTWKCCLLEGEYDDICRGRHKSIIGAKLIIPVWYNEVGWVDISYSLFKQVLKDYYFLNTSYILAKPRRNDRKGK